MTTSAMQAIEVSDDLESPSGGCIDTQHGLIGYEMNSRLTLIAAITDTCTVQNTNRPCHYWRVAR